MLKCTFSLDSWVVRETRSLHNDTNHVAVALSVNGQMVGGGPQTKFMGNQNNGTFPVGLSFPDVEVPTNAIVTMSYEIVNSGHSPSAVADALKAALESRIAKSAGKLVDLVFANCDGPITPPHGRQIVWNDSELAAISSGTTFTDKQDEPGNDSPHGCGSNSHYIVQYSVTRL
jgi:hypothetical protein